MQMLRRALTTLTLTGAVLSAGSVSAQEVVIRLTIERVRTSSSFDFMLLR